MIDGRIAEYQAKIDYLGASDEHNRFISEAILLDESHVRKLYDGKVTVQTRAPGDINSSEAVHTISQGLLPLLIAGAKFFGSIGAARRGIAIPLETKTPVLELFRGPAYQESKLTMERDMEEAMVARERAKTVKNPVLESPARQTVVEVPAQETGIELLRNYLEPPTRNLAEKARFARDASARLKRAGDSERARLCERLVELYERERYFAEDLVPLEDNPDGSFRPEPLAIELYGEDGARRLAELFPKRLNETLSDNEQTEWYEIMKRPYLLAGINEDEIEATLLQLASPNKPVSGQLPHPERKTITFFHGGRFPLSGDYADDLLEALAYGPRGCADDTTGLRPLWAIDVPVDQMNDVFRPIMDMSFKPEANPPLLNLRRIGWFTSSRMVFFDGAEPVTVYGYFRRIDNKADDTTNALRAIGRKMQETGGDLPPEYQHKLTIPPKTVARHPLFHHGIWSRLEDFTYFAGIKPEEVIDFRHIMPEDQMGISYCGDEIKESPLRERLVNIHTALDSIAWRYFQLQASGNPVPPEVERNIDEVRRFYRELMTNPDLEINSMRVETALQSLQRTIEFQLSGLDLGFESTALDVQWCSSAPIEGPNRSPKKNTE